VISIEMVWQSLQLIAVVKRGNERGGGTLREVGRRYMRWGQEGLRREGGGVNLGGECLNFLKEARQMHHHAVAHHTLGVAVEDAGWHQVQCVLGTVVIVDGVARVGTPLRVQ